MRMEVNALDSLAASIELSLLSQGQVSYGSQSKSTKPGLLRVQGDQGSEKWVAMTKRLQWRFIWSQRCTDLDV